MSISRADLVDFRLAVEVVSRARSESDLLHVVLDMPSVREATQQRPHAYELRDATAFKLPGSTRWWPTVATSSSSGDAKAWRRHLRAQLTGDIRKTRSFLDRTLHRVASTAPCEPLRLVPELWSRCWIFDEALAGALLLGCMPLARREPDAIAVVIAQKAELRRSQKEATTAFEWAAACFKALPLLAFAQAALDPSCDADARRYARVADEMRVDLRHSLYAIAATALFPDRPVFEQVRAGHDEMSARHLTRTRFSLPQRWQEMKGPTTNYEAIRILAMLVAVIHRAGWRDVSPRFAAAEVGVLTDSSPILSGWRGAPLYAEHRADNLPPGFEGVSATGGAVTPTTTRPSRPRRLPSRSFGPLQPTPTRAAALALNAEAEDAAEASDRMPIRFVALLLCARTWRAVAPRHLTHDAWEVTKSLTGLRRQRVLAIWMVDLSAPRPTCCHPECAFGQLFLGPRVQRGVSSRSLVDVVAVEVADWLTQARPYPVTFDVRDVVVQVENKASDLTTGTLDLTVEEQVRWHPPNDR